MVGQYGIATAVVAPVIAFANLQLRGLQGTDAAEEFAFSDYLALRLISSIAALLVVVAIILSSAEARTMGVLILFVALRMAINSIADVYYGLFQQREQIDKTAIAGMMTSVANVVLLAAGMWMTGNLAIAVACAAFSSVGPLVLHNIPTAKRLLEYSSQSNPNIPTFNWSRLLSLFLQALPLAIVSLLISLDNNIPRYLLISETDAATLGVFVALVSLLVASDTVAMTIARPVSPRLAKYFVARDRQLFLALLAKVTMLAFGLGCLGVSLAYFFGPSVVSRIYEPVYGEEAGAIFWLSVAAAIRLVSRFIGVSITAARRLYIQVLNNILGVAILTVSCLILIPDRGLEGAIIAIAISSMSRLVLNGSVLWRLVATWSSALPAGKV